jgi:hypothetical protein
LAIAIGLSAAGRTADRHLFLAAQDLAAHIGH